jgi:hypothetical protein
LTGTINGDKCGSASEAVKERSAAGAEGNTALAVGAIEETAWSADRAVKCVVDLGAGEAICY